MVRSRPLRDPQPALRHTVCLFVRFRANPEQYFPFDSSFIALGELGQDPVFSETYHLFISRIPSLPLRFSHSCILNRFSDLNLLLHSYHDDDALKCACLRVCDPGGRWINCHGVCEVSRQVQAARHHHPG